MKVSYLQASVLTLALFAAPGPVAAVAQEAPMVLAQEEPPPDGGQVQQDCDPQDPSCPSPERKRKKKHDNAQQQDGSQQGQDQPPPAQDIQQQDQQGGNGEQQQPPQHKRKKKQNVAEPDQTYQQDQAQPQDVQQYQQEESPPQPPPRRKTQQDEAQPPAQPDQTPPASAGNGAAAAFLQSVRPASELSEEELRQQMRRAFDLSKAKGLSPDQRQGLRDVIREGRTALRSKGAAESGQANSGGEAPDGGQAEVQPPLRKPKPEQQQTDQQQGGNQQQGQGQPGQMGRVNPALERQAQMVLNDDVDVRALNRRQLRQRLSGMRDLLASGQLSPQTTDALRQKLASERQVLRNEVSADEGGGYAPPPGGGKGNPPPPPPGGGKGNRPPGNNHGSNGPNIDINIVLGDRRPPDDLQDGELVRRIDVYRDAVGDDRYSEEERLRWRHQMDRDRYYLRERMLMERRQREERLRSGDIEFNVDIEDSYMPDRRVPPSVFAAEAEDDELADVLAAPPRRQIDRRYSVDEFESSPEARDAVARIEIDTVHFGFGEGFLREEEIDKLDRIAVILEKILAKHPNEVFLLEGHTDAVGSDSANLQLSRQRAAAVKEALVTYYVIPPENLKTVGLGERYLKIPTQEPEAENRRVSLARITPLVGQAD